MPEMHSAMAMPEPDRLAEELWEVVLLTTQGIEIHDGCEVHLHDFIRLGAERMAGEGRVGENDVSEAKKSLRLFVERMKVEAVAAGHPGWIGEDTFFPAKAHFEEHARVGFTFALWPFWPW